VGESQGAKVSREASQESQTQNECSSESENCGGSQGPLEESQSSGEEFAVTQSQPGRIQPLQLLAGAKAGWRFPFRFRG